MTFLFADLAAFALATLAAIVLLILPGFGVLRLVTQFAAPAMDEDRSWWGLVLGIATLPAIDALLVRCGGIPVAIALHLLLALVGGKDAFAAIRSMPIWAWAIAALWWAIVAYGLADFGGAGSVNQPLTVLDTVKHAAVIASISANGLPLVDPFFARDTAAGYYHYFYIGPALIDWITGAEDARPAFMAGAWVAGVSFFAMAMLVARRSGLIAGSTGRFAAILALLFCISGLDLLPMLGIWLRYHLLLGQLDWWSETVGWGVGSLLWVPHHLSALTAAMAACLLIAGAGTTRRAIALLLAGSALATAFGMSVWIAVAAAPALALWWIMQLKAWKSAVLGLPIAAVVAAALALPQFVDLMHGRAVAGIPLALAVRPFGGGWTTSQLVDFGLLPLSFVLEFGLFAYGAWRWRANRPSDRQDDLAHLLTILFVVGLLCGLFVRSTVINNDFGWRAIWLAQLPALLWTAGWLAQGVSSKSDRAIVALLGTLGLAATIVDGIGLRAVREPAVETTLDYINRHPRIDAELRMAYHWANRQLPPDAVIQHNPTIDERALSFGLYSRHRTGVADAEAQLFGAAAPEMLRRMSMIAPVFSELEPLAETRQRLATIGADTILLTSRDPLWQRTGGPPPQWACLYRTVTVCIAQPGRLEQGR